MNTVYEITSLAEARNYLNKQHRGTQNTNTNRRNITQVFSDQHHINMPTPKIPINYNNEINAVHLVYQ